MLAYHLKFVHEPRSFRAAFDFPAHHFMQKVSAALPRSLSLKHFINELQVYGAHKGARDILASFREQSLSAEA